MESQRTGRAHHPVLVVMGVSGSGKSTVAGILAGALKWDLQEGDDLHPDANVAKMAAGQPLTDEDRLPWLHTIADWIAEHTTTGKSGIVTCSALKRSYRDILRSAARPGADVIFVHLAGSKDRISGRLNARMNHFMPSSLLDTQLSTLEPLFDDENAIVIDIGPSPTKIAEQVLTELEKRAGMSESH